MPAPQPEPVSIDHETIFSGPFSLDQLGWIGAGLLLLLTLLGIRDFIFARKKWIVPILFLLRSTACAGVLIALAAPAEMTRQIFESGHQTLGIYLDTSTSMKLRDPVDGKGHLTRWELATRESGNRTSPLAAIDEALTRVEVARSLAADSKDNPASLELLREQLDLAYQIISKNKPRFPYPGLVDDICALLRIASEPQKVGDSDVSEILKRISILSRELARREESLRNPTRESESPSRLELAKTLLDRAEQSALNSPGDDLEVLRYQFSEEIIPLTREWRTESESPATNLNAALNQIANQYRTGQIDAAFLITDAVNNETDGATLQVPAGLKNFPLFLIPSGGDYQLNDVTLWRASAPGTIGQGDFLSVDCLVGARGFSGQTTRLRLLENETELDSVEVTFKESGEDQKFRLTTPVKSPGTHRFEVEIIPLPGELQTGNNRESIDVNVFTGDLKVLLVDGWPRWETRYLSNLLKRDNTMDHREILFAPVPPDPFPDTLSSRDQLSAFQIVVLGEVGPGFLGAAEITTLENYVNDGGNLIVLAGQETMPAAFQNTKLADLLPVHLDRQRPQMINQLHLVPTPAGRRIAALSLEDDRSQNEAVWRLGSTLLPLTELSPFNLPKPGAQVILESRTETKETPALPYIVWHRYGAGRVFYFPSPTTYHLRYRFGDRYHYRFWGQFLRWSTMAEILQGNASIDISTNEKRYRENDTPGVQIELRDSEGEPVTKVPVEISLESFRSGYTQYACSEVPGKPGVYETTLPNLQHGDYTVRAAGAAVEKLVAQIRKNGDKGFVAPEAGFIIEAPDSSEDGDRTCNWEAIQQLVESTGGAVIPPESMETAIEVLTQKKVKTSREEITQNPLWNRWPLFFLILIFLAAEWAGRKYAGLI